MTDKIAQTLCRAAASENVGTCPYCKRGQCQPVMWRTFLKEATAVWNMLKASGIKEPMRLPGLGAPFK